jgi:ABC-type lipoprotein export system ATPase subunit/GNAT superfamily N-acetyltransferase
VSRAIRLTSSVPSTGRVLQVRSMFDVAKAQGDVTEVMVPDDFTDLNDRDWHIGLIVGPSGSGKSTIARTVWPDEYADTNAMRWTQRAIVDDFPEGMPIKQITGLLSSVGFGSAPAWLRPHSALSVGQQFRAGLARALAAASYDAPAVMDEFTSTVDRRVAQIGSAAVAKTVRRTGTRLVAVSCHADVIDWLQPDWVYRPDSVDFEWRRLQPRPRLDFEVAAVGRDAWALFRPHHYLSGDLHVAARQVCAFHDGEPVAFNAWYRFPHPTARNIMVNHRIVVLPDWQGAGLGMALSEHVGEHLRSQGDRYRITTAHPGLISAMRRSPRWRESKGTNAPSRSRKPKRLVKQHANPRKLATSSFEYAPRA